MTSTAVQIISIIAPVGAVVLGFALGVWWNSYQQKKRDEREVKAFKIKLKVDLYYILVLLVDLESLFYKYKEKVGKQEQPVGWSDRSDFSVQFSIPLSFLIKEQIFAELLYKFEKNLNKLNDFMKYKKGILDHIIQQYIKDMKEGKDSVEMIQNKMLSNFKVEGKEIDDCIPYVQDLKEMANDIFSVMSNKYEIEELQKELQARKEENQNESPIFREY